ncbi:MAG: hypothetical protein ACMUIP_14065 [bacterium]
MDKIFDNKKSFLAMGIVFVIAVICAAGPALSAVSYAPVQGSRLMTVNQALTGNVPVFAMGELLLIDNFEYWESPLNQGWHAHEPAFPGGYPVWGMNIGAGMLSTVLDFQEGSRVLEVFYQANVLVPDMQKYMVSYRFAADIPISGSINDYKVLGLKMRAPVSIESFDSVGVIALCNGGAVEVHLTPRASEDFGKNYPVEVPEETAAVSKGLFPFTSDIDPVTPGHQAPVVVEVRIGREAEDGSWHLIRVDLAAALAKAGQTLTSISGIVLVGNQFRCDDIKLLTAAGNSRNACPPYLFHINHVFTQIFDPHGYRRYIFASDDVADNILPHEHTAEAHHGHHGEIGYGNTGIFAQLNGVGLDETNFAFWQATAMPLTAADQAITFADYVAAVNAYNATLATPDPDDVDPTLKDVRRAAIQTGGREITIGLGAGGAPVTVDARLVYPLDAPMLTDPVMAEGPVASDGGVNMLQFSASVGGAHELGTSATLIQRVPTTESIPYYPLYGIRSGVRSILSGEPYLAGDEVKTIQMALFYGGYDYWPTVAVLVIPPQQTIENMVVTVVCSDGLSEDVESFMIETVNYPVTNHPPIIEDVDDQIFYVDNGPQEYQLNATDADSFTYSSAVQFESDMQDLAWTAYLDGYPAYTYGPFTETLITQKSGLIRFDPQFEGAYEMMVTVRDPKGAEAYAAFTIYCVNRHTWLNHPPVMLGDWDHPMIGKQGQELQLHFTDIVDPDDEPLYYSCNIGSIGYVDGVPVWSFQTEYPGTYMLEIVAYDTRGGYLVIPQEIIITTWWSN